MRLVMENDDSLKIIARLITEIFRRYSLLRNKKVAISY